MVAVLRCDSAAQNRADELRNVKDYSSRVARYLEEAGVGCVTFSDLDLAPGSLRQARLVVLPYNPSLPDRAAEELTRHLGAGGRLLAFYGLPERLRPLAHIEVAGFFKPAQPNGFAAMRFDPDRIQGAPSLVHQHSWNILEPRPVPHFSQTVAQWLNEAGQASGHAAAVASSNAVLLSHVVLEEDAGSQRRLLLALAGHLVPELWRQTADASIARIGRLGGYANFDATAAALERAAQADARVSRRLAAARDLRQSALRLRERGRYAEACDRATDAAQRMLETFCTAQPSAPGEFRAFWCHSAFGVEGMSWDAAAATLAENGFTAVLPNMLWGGTAYYQSAVLPVAPEVAQRGDQIEKCLAACRKHGLQVHVWKVNWNLGHAPKDFVERMRQAGRLQASSRGQEEPWLCPSHPENQQLEIASMVEVARRYPVDGLHFDYIRYPDGDHCYCAGCRDRFAQASGLSMSNWPQDVLRAGPHRRAWLDWRRDTITRVVKGVSEQARVARPGIKLSAAVFRNWPVDRDDVGQDWKLWCDQRYLDFVCPMDYTSSAAQFENWAAQQTVWAGAVPCYPGIGAWVLSPDRVIDLIQITRRHNTKGFVVFNYDARAARDLLPLLGLGTTRK
jgi:uncharacterized lipoprotein YddW (UPF0748 family)